MSQGQMRSVRKFPGLRRYVRHSDMAADRGVPLTCLISRDIVYFPRSQIPSFIVWMPVPAKVGSRSEVPTQK